jgi:drug/metabolite transporter (DMT)-like permease
LWLTALKYSKSPEKISSLVFLSPFLSIFFIAFFLHENIHISTIAGLLLIVCGIFLSKAKFKKAS